MFSSIRKRVVGIATTAVCLAAATACAGPAPAPTNGAPNLTFRMNLTAGSLTTLGLFVARDMGYFAKAGLQAQSVTTNLGTSALQLLTSEQLDVASIDIPSAINARAAGADIAIVSGLERHAPVALQCRKDIGATPGYPAGVTSLAGKSIGITAVGAASDTFGRIILSSAGVDPAKVSLVPLGGVPNFIAAIKAKRVDCVMSFQPIQHQLADEVQTIVDVQKGEGPAILTNAAYGVAATTNKFATANPEVITRFRQAIKAANAFLADPANAPAVATGVASDYPGVSHDELVTLVRAVQATYADGETIPASAFEDSVKAYNLAYGKNITANQSELVLK
ncbi:ABC transporter substrate-binding protein [Amycolatopsis pithecellobii]|uniref:SsuA/THI5-like domain-containing protein n=1 Tax=Amycolatopsis pithecellobii TaxID=664692 RepID=A0A6N7YWI2_9PSEU|nr:ABC transporter substrate-binding protein [Amycolatopsis pithecellobii]MTD53233.1 hypothetical protein [Amycolatopsis pithecellobii]